MKITEAAINISILGYVWEARGYEGDEKSMIPRIATKVDEMVPVLLNFDKEARKVEGDIKLTAIGRGEKLIALYTAYRAQLGLTELDKRIEMAGKELELLKQVAPPKSDDPLAPDIRNHVKSLQSSGGIGGERSRFLVEHADDPQVVAAVLGAPAYLSGLSEAEYSMFQRQALERAHPERAGRIDLLERTIAGAERARGNAEKMLTTRAGVRYDEARQRWVHELSGAFGPEVSR